MTIEHLDFPLCDHHATRPAQATHELTVSKGQTAQHLYLCDPCRERLADNWMPLACGITVTITPIGET